MTKQSTATGIAKTDWSEIYRQLGDKKSRIYWRPGEHLSIIGPTGSGKTYLMICLFPLRQYLTLYVSKAEDSTLNGLTSKRQGENRFYKLRDYADRPKWLFRLLLWPSYDKPGDEQKQQLIFYRALRQQFMERGWTVAVDEVAHFVDLRLDGILSSYWKQGRSLGLTLMAATQRPSGVPLLMYGMPSHLFFFRFRDERDLKRIGGIGFLDRKEIVAAVSRLEQHEFLYIHVPTGYMAISKAEREQA